MMGTFTKSFGAMGGYIAGSQVRPGAQRVFFFNLGVAVSHPPPPPPPPHPLVLKLPIAPSFFLSSLTNPAHVCAHTRPARLFPGVHRSHATQRGRHHLRQLHDACSVQAGSGRVPGDHRRGRHGHWCVLRQCFSPSLLVNDCFSPLSCCVSFCCCLLFCGGVAEWCGVHWHVLSHVCVCFSPSTCVALPLCRHRGTPGARKLAAIRENGNFFRKGLKDIGCEVLGDEDSPIIPIMLYNPTKIAAFSRECFERGVCSPRFGALVHWCWCIGALMHCILSATLTKPASRFHGRVVLPSRMRITASCACVPSPHTPHSPHPPPSPLTPHPSPLSWLW
jgi:hypothetical protein